MNGSEACFEIVSFERPLPVATLLFNEVVVDNSSLIVIGIGEIEMVVDYVFANLAFDSKAPMSTNPIVYGTRKVLSDGVKAWIERVLHEKLPLDLLPFVLQHCIIDLTRTVEQGAMVFADGTARKCHGFMWNSDTHMPVNTELPIPPYASAVAVS